MSMKFLNYVMAVMFLMTPHSAFCDETTSEFVEAEEVVTDTMTSRLMDDATKRYCAAHPDACRSARQRDAEAQRNDAWLREQDRKRCRAGDKTSCYFLNRSW